MRVDRDDVRAAAGPGPTPPRGVRSRGRPRVLLAEDDGSMRGLLARQLRRDGVEVFEAGSGLELLFGLHLHACGLATGAGVDLLITDCRMPSLSGLDALTWLRRTDRDTPAILITAFADEETRRAAGRLGAQLFDKPFDVDDLRNAVAHIARSRR